MEAKSYLYSVHPKRIIKGLESVDVIRAPKSLYLTLEDVKKCIRLGTVYRRFSSSDIARVNTANVERLHNEKHMNEDEYKQFLITQSSAGQQTVTKHEEVKQPEPEKKETTHVVTVVINEEKKAESDPVVNPTVDNTTDESKSAGQVEEKKAEEVKSEDKNTNNVSNNHQNNNSNPAKFQGKNKKN